MDWTDTPEQAKFRGEVRTFIEQRLPQRYRRETQQAQDGGEELSAGWQADRKSRDGERRQTAIEWADALAERGWIAPAWPKQYGGGGLSVMEQFIYNHEMSEADAPPVGGLGVSLLGPTLIRARQR